MSAGAQVVFVGAKPIYQAPEQALTLGVDLLSDLERVRVGKVGVGRRYGEYETALLADKLEQHGADLDLNVCRLVPHRDLGHAGQVNQGQVENWTTNSGIRFTLIYFVLYIRYIIHSYIIHSFVHLFV